MTRVCVTLPKLAVTELSQGCVSLLGLSCRLMGENDLGCVIFQELWVEKVTVVCVNVHEFYDPHQTMTHPDRGGSYN